jgi:hypothetical protein
MKRVLAVMTVIAAFAMLNGCSKCSQEKPAEAPPVMEAPPAAPADPAAPPADPATPPPAEGTTPPPAGEVK